MEVTMKLALALGLAAASLAALGGCAVVPLAPPARYGAPLVVEPAVVVAPAPVVVRGYWYRGWRRW
jgi:hypothetical protein